MLHQVIHLLHRKLYKSSTSQVPPAEAGATPVELAPGDKGIRSAPSECIPI